MARILYSEQQSFRQVTWIWIVLIPLVLLSSAGILYGFYQQIILGEPWGNEPMSNGGMITALLVVVFIQVFVIWLITSIRLDIAITGSEFRYKFFAWSSGWKTLTREQINGFSVVRYSFWKGKGLGYRVSPISKTVRMIIKPDHIATLELRDGRTIMMSTVNKAGMERAMQKLMSTSENI